MRLLVFGGWGQLGSDLALAAHGRHEMARPRRSEVDVTDGAAVARRSILLDTRSAELGLPPSRSWEEALEWYLGARPRLPVGAAAEGSE